MEKDNSERRRKPTGIIRYVKNIIIWKKITPRGDGNRLEPSNNRYTDDLEIDNSERRRKLFFRNYNILKINLEKDNSERRRKLY